MSLELKLNLDKGAETLKLCLQKAGMTYIPEVDVALDMDVSGSFEDEHEDGLTDDVTTRLVPWGLVFDPDKKLDFFTFSSRHGGRPPAHYVGEVTADNCQGYIRRNVIRKVPNWNGGTLYAPILQMNREHFGWAAPSQTAPQKPGFLARAASAFGGGGSSSAASAAPAGPKRKSLILFVTDGDNDDRRETEELLEEMERLGDQVYIQFFALNNDKSVRFEFLQRMADKFSNTGLYICRDVQAFAKMSDEQINELIISDELIAWLKK